MLVEESKDVFGNAGAQGCLFTWVNRKDDLEFYPALRRGEVEVDSRIFCGDTVIAGKGVKGFLDGCKFVAEAFFDDFFDALFGE